MTKIDEIIAHLRPNAEWLMHNDSIDELTFLDNKVKPITKTEFDNSLKDYELKKSIEAQAKAAAKTALLERLGITTDEAALLLS